MNVVFGLREELIEAFLRVRSRLFGSEDLFVAELRGALERRYRVIGPEALKIWLAVRSAHSRARGA